MSKRHLHLVSDSGADPPKPPPTSGAFDEFVRTTTRPVDILTDIHNRGLKLEDIMAQGFRTQRRTRPATRC